MIIASKTLRHIEDMLSWDQGAAFRQMQQKTLPELEDAYDGDTFPFRTHLGASIIGRRCAREIWYSFRWSKRVTHEGRILRLFNRGHLEEGRFIALLRCIGVQVLNKQPSGKQYRVSYHDGHMGGSCDGIVTGVPDLESGCAAVAEFKTHGEKSYNDLITRGVEKAKPEHYIQMQIYMHGFQLPAALYLAVNKNTDAIHGEIVYSNPQVAANYIERGRKILVSNEPPPKISKTPSWYECKFCDFNKICHRNETVQKTCRTCVHAALEAEARWKCTRYNCTLTKEQQFEACGDYTPLCD